MDVSARMLELLSALQGGHELAGTDLARRLGSSPRTLRRDVDRLRSLGYPVRARPGPGGHYRLVAGTAMPPLLLDDDESVAVAVGLRTAAPVAGDDAAARALRKLEQVLPSRLRHRVAAVHAATEVATPATAADTAVLGVVGAAAARHERLELGYTARDGSAGRRRVEPYRQVMTRGRWYLLAWDLDRDDWRTFRLDRVTDPVPTGVPFDPRELPAESAAAYLDARLTAPRLRAVITFLAPVETVADRLARRDGTLEAAGPDRCRFTTHVDSWEWLAVTTATLGVEFRVEEPAAFAEYCAGLARRLDRAAGGRPEAAPDPSSTPPPGMASEPGAGAGHGHRDPAPRERWID